MKRNGKNAASNRDQIRVAIYTRKSTEEGLDQEFNSLDAQRQAIEAYIQSQRGEGWVAIPTKYDDGGFSGANTNRPAFQRLLQDIEAGKVDIVAVYKIDRLSRSLLDFSRIIEFLEKKGVEFVAVTQQFSTANSMGKLTLNILMSFAEFERQVISERTKDKMGATRKKGMWTGGRPALGYDLVDKKLLVNEAEAAQVREIFQMYLEYGSLLPVVTEINRRGWVTKEYTTKEGKPVKGHAFDKALVGRILSSPIYLGQVEYEGERYEGAHDAIIDEETFNAVQERLEAHQGNGRKGRSKWNALLMGLTRCGVCGGALTHHYVSKAGKRFHYYVCEQILKKGAAACPGSRISMTKLETAVIERIRNIGADPVLFKETVTALKKMRQERLPVLQTEARTLDRTRQNLVAERRELLKAIGREESGAPVSLNRLKEIEDRFEKVKMRLEEIHLDLEALKQHIGDEKQLQTALRAFSPVWDQLFPHEKARILKLLLESVTFTGKDGTVEIRFRDTGIKTLAAEFDEEEAA